MYNEFFGFKEAPFSIAPDPQFLYMSERHREALAHLLYGLKTDGGFILLTGEVGTGKTTVCQCLLEQVPEDTEIAFVLNPRLSVVELLATICDELHIPYIQGDDSIKMYIDAINDFLLQAHADGRKTVLIIDEAQNLQVDVLEQIRLLTNLETHKQKLLQVIMLGQPELKLLLEQPELRQLEQRITARYHLEPLSRNEIQAYIRHRLAVAGVERPMFPQSTTSLLYHYSGGVPRLINLLCDRALLGAYVREQHKVSPLVLKQAAREVFGRPSGQRPLAGWVMGAALLLALIGCGLLLQNYLNSLPQPQVTADPVPQKRLPISRDDLAEPLRWADSASLERSSVLAYQALFALWGKDFQPLEGTATEQAERLGLKLITRRGSLGRLRQLDRPAVLKIIDPNGQEFYATLTALETGRATLVVGQQVRVVPVDILNRQWMGEFSLLWQAPPDYQQALQPGAAGRLVEWLEERMAQLNQRAAISGSGSVLAGELLEEVRQFQSDVGLEPDGVVGSYTLILLNSRTGTGFPSLAVKRG